MNLTRYRHSEEWEDDEVEELDDFLRGRLPRHNIELLQQYGGDLLAYGEELHRRAEQDLDMRTQQGDSR